MPSVTSKKVYLQDIGQQGNMGPWNLADENYRREVRVYEVDRVAEILEEYKNETTRARKSNVSGSYKYGIGMPVSDGVELDIDGEVTAGLSWENSEKVTNTVQIKTIQGHDPLGTFFLNFYSPLINSRNGNNYEINTYDNGGFSFGVTVK